MYKFSELEQSFIVESFKEGHGPGTILNMLNKRYLGRYKENHIRVFLASLGFNRNRDQAYKVKSESGGFKRKKS